MKFRESEKLEVFDLKKGILTVNGLWVDVFNLNPDNININDIAWALSMNCRFNGHTKEFYSVAEHSIWVADQVSQEYKLAALMHDASEAYLTDVPSPFKQYMPDYKKIEHTAMIEIAKRFGFEYPLPVEVKKADYDALAYEWVNIVKSNNITPLTQKQSNDKFLIYFYEFTNK